MFPKSFHKLIAKDLLTAGMRQNNEQNYSLNARKVWSFIV